MRRFEAFVFFLFVFLPSLAGAAVFTCNSTGTEKTIFYTNETIFVASSTNITPSSATVKFYIATHRTWSSGANLTAAVTTSKDIATNSSGHVPATLMWSPTLTVGTYDLIADVNNSATLDSEDQLYNASGSGFIVSEQQVPTLTVAKGAGSPPNHDWNADTNGSQKNVMLQTSLTAGSFDSVKLTSLALVASGTGDDKAGVSIVAVYSDDNWNGQYDQGEPLISYGQYIRDDGIISFDMTDKLTVNANSTTALIFVYTMTGSSGSTSGNTYSFQLASITGVGANTGMQARINSFSINSAVKTVYSSAAATTTTTVGNATTTSTTTTTIPTTTTTIPPEDETKDLLVGLATAGVVVVAILALIYFFVLKPPKVPQYAPQQF